MAPRATSTRPILAMAAASSLVIVPPLSRYITRNPLSKVMRYAIVPSASTRGSLVPRAWIATCSASCSAEGRGVVRCKA